MLHYLLGVFVLLPFSYTVNDSVIAFSPNDFVSVQQVENGTRRKSILRYGFHRTSECSNFEKAYLCIQKCLDLKYDVAYADKKCYCTCYVKKDKAKYTDKSGTQEKWKLGAPTTKIPIWAKKKDMKPVTHIDDAIELDDLNANDTSVFKNRTIADKIVGNKTSVTNVNIGKNTTAAGAPLSNSTDIGVNATTIGAKIAVTTAVG